MDRIPRLVRADPQVVGVRLGLLDLLQDLADRVLVAGARRGQQATLLIRREREVIYPSTAGVYGERISSVMSLLVATPRLRPGR